MPDTDLFNLERFVTAQAPVFAAALAELKAGRKQSHWMWFVFPQLRGLARSSTADFYGIGTLDEARAYLAHPVLGPRLTRCTEALLDHRGAVLARKRRLAGRPQVLLLHDVVLTRGRRERERVPAGAPSLLRVPVGRADAGASRTRHGLGAQSLPERNSDRLVRLRWPSPSR